MSVTFLSEYAKDPARAVRRQLEALWARNEGECKQSAKDARNEELMRGYAGRRPIKEPPSAA